MTMTTRILAIVQQLVILATGRILLILYLVVFHLQLGLGGDILEGTGWWVMCRTHLVAFVQASTCTLEIFSSFLPGSLFE